MGRASEGAVTAEDAEHGEKARTDAAAKDREARRGRGEGAASQEETREAPLTLCDEFAHTQRLEEAALRDSRQTTQRSVADGQEGGSEGERERAADRDGSRSASELHPAEANAEACGRDPDGAVVSLPERCESADLEEQSECLPEHLRLAFFALLDDEKARALPSPASSSAPSASRPPSAPTPPSSWSSSGP
ncbi:hypothetical protein BESB_016730 [Besnoitia besnoiti]|uniref:Uncharacterized protein n=1 Tax=Besnoitia besnoiti TaxID=94643 RepID=A0A2A9M322_BESBE|nr:hypothetical protein BESB_016730 [Besnoitia besnoiti]PFH32355.1 hypothetical protein BESB_016730 [Besnoitia besnoiti]